MTIRRRGSQFEVTTKTGRVLGTHPTRKAAERQLVVIEASKVRQTAKGAVTRRSRVPKTKSKR